MPEFAVCVERVYRVTESTRVAVGADTPEAALRKAKRRECEQGFDDWSEDGGEADIDSYQWEVKNGGGETLLTGEGTADDEIDDELKARELAGNG